jgi:hypothetical protein
MKTVFAILCAAAAAAAAHATVYETQTYAGPFNVYAPQGSAGNATLAATFTGMSGGTPYTPMGVLIQMNITALGASSRTDVMIRCTPPAGSPFVVAAAMAFNTINNTDTGVALFPVGTVAVGAWSFEVYDAANNNGASPEESVQNVSISLIDHTNSMIPCLFVDLGSQGGVAGADGQHDNNDFVVFISDFFTMDPHADIGIQGGTPGTDGLFDNNDLIVFIDFFFLGC